MAAHTPEDSCQRALLYVRGRKQKAEVLGRLIDRAAAMMGEIRGLAGCSPDVRDAAAYCRVSEWLDWTPHPLARVRRDVARLERLAARAAIAKAKADGK